MHWKHDRVLLTIYLIALFGLLMAPINGPKYSLLNIEIDKWIHAALFAGLAVFLRWNLSATRHAVVFSVGIASVIAGVTEVVQDLVAYRDSDIGDALAGTFGAIIGGVGMDRVLLSSVSDQLIGTIVIILGLATGVTFLVADEIGLSENDLFGTLQIVGTLLGLVIAIGGVGMLAKGLCPGSRIPPGGKR